MDLFTYKASWASEPPRYIILILQKKVYITCLVSNNVRNKARAGIPEQAFKKASYFSQKVPPYSL